MSTAETSGVREKVHAALGAARAIGAPADMEAPSWVTRARSFAYLVAALARLGRQSPDLRRWYAGNRLRQLSAGLQCSLHADCVSSPARSVSPCPGFAVGNLHESSFAEIWNGAPMREFRKRPRSAGMLPICARCCSLWRYD